MKFRGLVSLSRLIHMLSSVWVLILAITILVDVFGRILFLSPLPGTKEILQNSVIAVAFLQLPLAIFSASMLRTTLLSDVMPAGLQRVVRTVGNTDKWPEYSLYVSMLGLFIHFGMKLAGFISQSSGRKKKAAKPISI